MKKLLLIAFLQFLTVTLFAQSVIDKKNGFRHYKIGADYSLYAKEISSNASGINSSTKHYGVKEKIQVVGHPASVDLVFVKNKLTGINVRFLKMDSDDYDEVLKALETVYGKAKNTALDSNRPSYLKDEVVNVWNGKLVGLQFSLDQTNYEGTITIWGMNKVKSNYEGEF
ncbi:hypothetical protein TH61_16210 [Rufibacter sp. DG15C]|uniref:hypothetical protein n=1 Tax=Rufibacter sp. DG15C TaxID=1379909 RepID=UPI00078E3D22|nr:hypothetical protein [Rufibacter sp. DG15C]AMM52422.1 hypothetical protein TH61_16210 [Rufibacter sp. DG15C]